MAKCNGVVGKGGMEKDAKGDEEDEKDVEEETTVWFKSELHFDPWQTVKRSSRGTRFPIARIKAIVGFSVSQCHANDDV